MASEDEEYDPQRVVQLARAGTLMLGMIMLIAAGVSWWAQQVALAWSSGVLGAVVVVIAAILWRWDPCAEQDRQASQEELLSRLEQQQQAGDIDTEQLARAKELLQNDD